jgi:phenylacetate-CoA ligase
MLSQSIKFTLRGFFRDLVRGMPARYFFYPRIRANEHSMPELERYIESSGGERRQPGLGILGDLSTCISKQDVRKTAARFIRRRTLKTLVRNTIKTSGTSGEPLTLHQDYIGILKEEAFVYRQLRWAGYCAGDRKVWLRGDVIRESGSRGEAVKCRDWWSNTLMLSSYHISNESAASYVASIAEFDPRLIQAYPSSIYALASWMLANRVQFKSQSLKAIVTSSETLTDEMRRKIEAAFGVRVFDWYGQAERVVAIGTCEHGGRHVLSDYGCTELIAADDGKHELVGTGYNNSAMSLVRYRTGDYVELDNRACRCKRVFPTVKRVIGRVDDVVVLSDGRAIGRLDHVFKGTVNVVQGQIVYRSPDRFTLRVVPGPRWSHVDETRLMRNFRERVDGVDVSIELRSTLPRGANGKVKFVVLEQNP